jgi:hypothetical protein
VGREREREGGRGEGEGEGRRKKVKEGKKTTANLETFDAVLSVSTLPRLRLDGFPWDYSQRDS